MSTEIKAIITDLDRTLLRTDKTISEYTVRVLEECRRRGIKLAIATARPEKSVRTYMEQISFHAVTTLNGAKIILGNGIYAYGIPRDSAQKILCAVMRIPGILISVETADGLFANVDRPEWGSVYFGGFPALPVDGVVYKILVSHEQGLCLEQLQAMLPDDVYSTAANGTLFQIMSKKATKWNGVRSMLKFMGVSENEAVYFGDDQDDLEPIACCGVGVAVANAIPTVLEKAKHITCSNDEDGVARFIEKNIL